MEWKGTKSDRFVLVRLTLRDGDSEYGSHVIFSRDFWKKASHLEVLEEEFGGIGECLRHGRSCSNVYCMYWLTDRDGAAQIDGVEYMTDGDYNSVKKFGLAYLLAAEEETFSAESGISIVKVYVEQEDDRPWKYVTFEMPNHILNNPDILHEAIEARLMDILQQPFGGWDLISTKKLGAEEVLVPCKSCGIEMGGGMQDGWENYYPARDICSHCELTIFGKYLQAEDAESFGVEAYDEKITVWICNACNRRYEDQNDAEDCCEGLDDYGVPYFDGKSKELREVHLHEAESFESTPYSNYYGACLTPDGGCFETTMENCRTLNGRFQGPGTSCGGYQPPLMAAEQSKPQGKGLWIAITVGVMTGVASAVFGNVISEMWLDRLREDPELHTTPEEGDPV
jgi:hypothetical protein